MARAKQAAALLTALFLLLSIGAAFPAVSSAQTAQPVPQEPQEIQEPARPDITARQVKEVKAASVGEYSIKISWSSLEGADGYLVYQSNSKNGSYKEIASTSALSYTKRKLVTGKRYYFKVAAYQNSDSGARHSQTSGAVSAAPRLKAPASVKLAAGEKKMTVRWTKVLGAGGYRIYRSTSAKGKFRRVASVSAKKRQYVNSGLQGNKKYYYKVRAYKRSKKTVLLGASSAVVSKKTPNMLQKRVDKVYKAAVGKGKKSREQRLRACYDYMIRHYTYTRRDYVPVGAKGWAASHANRFFRDRTGNCYDWAAAMYYLAKKCGYSPRIYSGLVHYRNGNTGRHGWTEITIGGVSYIFDPEMDWSYTHRVGSHYNGWKRRVGTTEMTYIKP